MLCSKLSGFLNSSDSVSISRNILLAEVSSQITVADIDDVEISVELVEHCLKEFGRNKSVYPFLCLLPRSLCNLWQNCSQLSSNTAYTNY